MENKKYEIVCDECKYSMLLKDLKLRTKDFRYKDVYYSITFFKCPKCGKYYLIEVLDYYARKLKDKYVRLLDRASTSKNKKLLVKEIEIAKHEAIDYQKKLMAEFKDTIPSSIINNLIY